MKKRPHTKTNLVARLNAAGSPLFLLDRKRKLVFFNAGCVELTGWPAEDVIGRVCRYASHGDANDTESLLGNLGPPPDVYSGRPLSQPAYLPHRDGRTLARLLHFFPLQDADGRVDHVLGLMSPLEEPSRVVETSPSQQLHAELAALRISLRRRYGLESVVAKSRPMIRVMEQVELARRSSVSVLFQGEAGTGKEHLARLIHYESSTHKRAFVPVDCHRLPAAALEETLSELLKSGEQEQTSPSALQPGTLYLKNVEHLPRDLQERLLEALPAEADSPGGPLRLMASSTIEVRLAVDEEHLREDFFYRLTPLNISLPSLRSRREDLPLLVQHGIEEFNRRNEKQIAGLSNPVWEQFRQYNWPGNVAELQAVIEGACHTCGNELIGVDHLPFRFRTGLEAQSIAPDVEAKPQGLQSLLQEVEKEHIQRVLQKCRSNKSKAAELLEIPRARLYRRMEALGIAEEESES